MPLIPFHILFLDYLLNVIARDYLVVGFLFIYDLLNVPFLLLFANNLTLRMMLRLHLTFTRALTISAYLRIRLN